MPARPEYAGLRPLLAIGGENLSLRQIAPEVLDDDPDLILADVSDRAEGRENEKHHQRKGYSAGTNRLALDAHRPRDDRDGEYNTDQ